MPAGAKAALKLMVKRVVASALEQFPKSPQDEWSLEVQKDKNRPDARTVHSELRRGPRRGSRMKTKLGQSRVWGQKDCWKAERSAKSPHAPLGSRIVTFFFFFFRVFFSTRENPLASLLEKPSLTYRSSTSERLIAHTLGPVRRKREGKATSTAACCPGGRRRATGPSSSECSLNGNALGLGRTRRAAETCHLEKEHEQSRFLKYRLHVTVTTVWIYVKLNKIY